MAKHSSAGKTQQGFTLIEILTVLFVVGFIVGGVSVFFNLKSPDEELKKTVEKFSVIANHISELSILSGEPIGLKLEPPEWRDDPLEQGWRYSWQKLTGEGFVELTDVPAVEIDNAIELNVFIDEQEWKYEDAPEVREPILYFYSTGEVTPFEIEFVHDEVFEQTQTVMVDVWGEVVWKERQEQREQEEAFN
ncbi:MAG: prepilin-type N-terminal cleavage/methylation domain-containing protein [Agarilytica sp.]